MPNENVQILQRVEIDGDECRNIPIVWWPDANVAIILTHGYFTLFVVRNRPAFHLRNGWDTEGKLDLGLRLNGWHFRDSFIDSEEDTDGEEISYEHIMKKPETDKSVIWFFKVEFCKPEYWMINIAKMVRDHLEIYG